ncbi:MAG: Ig-like domain-containing protein, partial [Candidatus Bathyarchaeota archaeon]|nr:Ig-like domain-containing protein [Candidatus Bathyarchaeota archaeon]
AALGKVDAKTAEAVVPQIVVMLDGNDRQAQRLAIIVLGNVGPAAKGVVPALAKMVAGKAHAHLRREAARALRTIGPSAKAAVPELIVALKSGDATLTGLAAEALGAIGPAAAPAVPQLSPLLKHGDASLRKTAAQALASIGAPSVPAFGAVVKEKGKGVDPAIVDAIGGLGKAAHAVAPDLLAAAKGATPDLIGRIDATLKKIKTQNAVPVVEDVAVECAEGRSVTIVLPATDADDVGAAVKAAIVRKPSHATLEQKGRTTFVFRSKAGFAGEDKFTWKATDGVGDSKKAKVVVTIAPDKQPPRLMKAVSDAGRTRVK